MPLPSTPASDAAALGLVAPEDETPEGFPKYLLMFVLNLLPNRENSFEGLGGTVGEGHPPDLLVPPGVLALNGAICISTSVGVLGDRTS